MNTQEMRDRIETLNLIIKDADNRIASNPTDARYVQTQRKKQREWSAEARMLKNQVETRTADCDPKCKDPKEHRLGLAYGIPHDATTCACKCHERPTEDEQ